MFQKFKTKQKTANKAHIRPPEQHSRDLEMKIGERKLQKLQTLQKWQKFKKLQKLQK